MSDIPMESPPPGRGADLMDRARVYTAGRTVLVLGGIPFPAQKRNLEAALGCSILWFTAERGKRLRRVKEAAARADLVIAAIKLSAHELVAFALARRRAGGPPLVLARAGLNPRRVAHEIITQLPARSPGATVAGKEAPMPASRKPARPSAPAASRPTRGTGTPLRSFVAALACGGAVLGASAGCRPVPVTGNERKEAPPQASAGPVHLYVGFDASGSARPLLGAGAALAAQLSEALSEGEDRLTLYRVDRRTDEFYDSTAADAASVLPLIVREVRPLPRVPGTFPAAFWQTVAARTGQKPQEQAVVLFIGDGDNDDQRASAERAILAAARGLGGRPGVRAVIVAGVSRQNRAAIRAALEPALGGRLHLLGPGELSPDAVCPFLPGR